ncbi:MAG: hypothetical protein ACE5FH_01575 [Candidatus Zixiibacteriota bacterium]
MKQLSAILLTGATVCLALSCTQGDKTVQLRFGLAPDATYSYDQTNRRNVRVTSGDSVLYERVENYGASYSMQVIEAVDDTTAEVVERVTWTWEEPNKDDSAQIDTVERSREMAMTMYATGRVSNLRVISGVDSSHFAYLRNYYEQGLPVFPAGEHVPGYTWTQTTKVVLPDQTLEASTTYRIKSLVREAGYDCAVLAFDGLLIMPLAPDPSDSTQKSGIDRIQTTGVIYFAYKEGAVVLQRERWVIDGDRSQINDDGEQINYKMAVELDTEITITGITYGS